MSKALILSNTGSPLKPEIKEIKEFLKNFLNDKKIIKIPGPVLFFILLIRPYLIKKHYKEISIEGISPLNYYLEKIREKLQIEFKNIKIEIGNLYGRPFLNKTIKKLLDKNIKNIYLLPLYPQESPATTEITKYHFEKIMEEKKFEGNILPPYYKEDIYLNALKERVQKHLEKEKIQHLLFSYHGLPEKMASMSDYKNQCFETSEILTKKLNLKNYSISFQSRFGFLKWLKPYTINEIKALAKNGIKNLAVICPSFPVDCLETYYEINIKLKKVFLNNGGEKFLYIKALNDSNEHIYFLKNFTSRYLNNF